MNPVSILQLWHRAWNLFKSGSPVLIPLYFVWLLGVLGLSAILSHLLSLLPESHLLEASLEAFVKDVEDEDGHIIDVNDVNISVNVFLYDLIEVNVVLCILIYKYIISPLILIPLGYEVARQEQWLIENGKPSTDRLIAPLLLYLLPYKLYKRLSEAGQVPPLPAHLQSRLPSQLRGYKLLLTKWAIPLYRLLLSIIPALLIVEGAIMSREVLKSIIELFRSIIVLLIGNFSFIEVSLALVLLLAHCIRWALEEAGILLALLGLISLPILSFFGWAGPYAILSGRAGPIDAFWHSFSLTIWNFGTVLQASLSCLALLIVGGIIPCGLGLLVVLPLCHIFLSLLYISLTEAPRSPTL